MRELPKAIPVLFLFSFGALAQTTRMPSQSSEEERLEKPACFLPDSAIRLNHILKASGSRKIRSFLPHPHSGGGLNVQVNDLQKFYPDGLIGRSEPTLAASESGQNLLAGFIDASGACGVFVDCAPEDSAGLTGFAFSTDGGRTWTDGGAPPIIDHAFTLLDPWADRGGRDTETFYLSTNSLDDVTFDIPGVNVFRGHFREKSFVWEDLRQLRPANPDDAFDRDVIVMAKNGGGAGYLSEANFIGECGQFAFGWGQIEVWRTHDGGDSWQGPAVVSPDVTDITDPSDPNCGLTGINQQGAQPVIGPRGELYVGWRFGPRVFLDSAATRVDIDVARSLNAGVSFDAPVVVASKNSGLFNPPVGFGGDGVADHPRLAVAPSGPHKGRVYVVYGEPVAAVSPAPLFPCPDPYAGSTCQEQTLTSAQVFLSFSDDRGLTWTPPAAVAPPVPPSGVKRFWPVVSVDSSGKVNVVYYESQERLEASNPVCAAFLNDGIIRYGAANSLVDTFLAQSLDGGSSFSPPDRLSTETSNWCTTYSDIFKNYGDYVGSISAADRVLSIWTDGRNGIPDVFFSGFKPAAKP